VQGLTESSPYTYPNFIKAGSLIGLRRLMLLNNLRLGGHVNYFDISQSKEGTRTYWIAWFFEREKNQMKALSDAVSGGSNA
jgi:hypothetical protein